MRKRNRVVTSLVIAASVAVTGACSSSKSASSSTSVRSGTLTSGNASNHATPTGSPVKIMAIAVRDTPILSEAELFDGAQTRVDAINATGGLNGHRLILEKCDSALDPNREQACLNQAVSDKVSAIVGSSILFSTFSSLEAVHIPLIASQGADPEEFKSSISYPFGGDFSWFVGVVAQSKKDGIKTAAIATLANDQSAFANTILKSAAVKAGITVTSTVASASTTVDFSAAAATVISKHPDAIWTTVTPQTFGALVLALRQAGYTGKIYVQSSGVTAASLQAMQGTAGNIEVSAQGRPLSETTNPQVSQFLSEMHQFAPSAKQDEFTELGWSGVFIFAELMAKATSFAGPDVITAANATTSPISGGLFGPFVGAGSSPEPAYPRLFNTSYIAGTVVNGVIQANGDFTDPYKALAP